VEDLEREIKDQPEEDLIEVAIGETSVVEAEAEQEEAELPAVEAEPVEPASEPPAEAEGAAEAQAVRAQQAAPAEDTKPAKLEVDVAYSPFEGPGEWYVVHTYAGYENKVKTNLHSRIGSMQMEDKIFDVVIPMEDVMEIKGGKKQVVQRKVFPGYLLVKMIYDNDSWY